VTIVFGERERSRLGPPAGDDPNGEETYQLMLASAAAPGSDLEAVEAEVAAWIAERLHQRGKAFRTAAPYALPHGREIRENICLAGCALAAPPCVSEVWQPVPVAFALVSKLCIGYVGRDVRAASGSSRVHSRPATVPGSTRRGGGCLWIAAESQ
jgi:hypothetical protein